MGGQLVVLNVGAGDITVSFDEANEGETRKAVQMLQDLMRRGYLIAVRLSNGTYTRAVDIDPRRGSYIVVAPDDVAMPPDATPVTGGKRPSRGRRVAVPIDKSQAYGVARSAGG